MPKQTIRRSLILVSLLAASTLAAPAGADQPSSTPDSPAPPPSGGRASESVPGSPEALPPPEQPPRTQPGAPRPLGEPAEAEPPSWFARPPLTLTVGEGRSRWRATIYG